MNLGKTAFSTIEASLFQKTCNIKLIANFLRFSAIIHMSKSKKRRRSYECWNTVHMQNFFRNSNTAISFHNAITVLQSGAGIIKEVGLEVTTAISPHQLIIQFLDMYLKAGILLEKLSVALLNVLDGIVLGLHLADVLLQAEAQVRACRHDLLKQGAHVLGVACHERPTRVVGWKLGVANGGHTLTPHRVALVPNGEQGDGGAAEDQQVVLTELREGLEGSPL
jgi:hypothetical protein